MTLWELLFQEPGMAAEALLMLTLMAAYHTESAPAEIATLAVLAAAYVLARRQWPAPPQAAAFAAVCRALATATAAGVPPERALESIGDALGLSNHEPAVVFARRHPLLAPVVGRSTPPGPAASRYLLRMARWTAQQAQMGANLRRSMVRFDLTSVIFPAAGVGLLVLHLATTPERAHCLHVPAVAVGLTAVLFVWLAALVLEAQLRRRVAAGSHHARDLAQIAAGLYHLAIDAGPDAATPASRHLERYVSDAHRVTTRSVDEAHRCVVASAVSRGSTDPTANEYLMTLADGFLERARLAGEGDAVWVPLATTFLLIGCHLPILLAGAVIPPIASAWQVLSAAS